MLTREHILSELRRTALEHGGTALGRLAFQTATGIKESDWRGRYWSKWNDAVREADLKTNAYWPGYGEDALLEKLATLIRRLGRFPTYSDIRLRSQEDDGFPNDKTFGRIGPKNVLVAKVVAFCRAKEGYEDVASIAQLALVSDEEQSSENPSEGSDLMLGFVYLLKAGKFFKIGRTVAEGRRERELAIQLPERAAKVHVIKTDDAVGIERYWHERFADRRKNGEWFELSAQDVAAFKRRKFM